MIPVCKIDKFECVKFGKTLAMDIVGKVVQDLNNSFLLVGHSGNYIRFCSIWQSDADWIFSREDCRTGKCGYKLVGDKPVKQ